MNLPSNKTVVEWKLIYNIHPYINITILDQQKARSNLIWFSLVVGFKITVCVDYSRGSKRY